MPHEDAAAARERKTKETIADVTAHLEHMAKQIDFAVHETRNLSAAVMGSLQLLLDALRRIADRLERDLAAQDRGEKP